jgi:hypothetical protein
VASEDEVLPQQAANVAVRLFGTGEAIENEFL